MAPAKINLFLRILSRRADGYHELQTAFQFLGLCDILKFSYRDDGKISRADNGPGYGAGDLILRAAEAIKTYTNCKSGVDIELIKKIPEGGGLGGGSSDAATTLVTLNELWQTNLELSELAELGKNLGADVPVFIYGKACIAEGIGEKIQYMNFLQAPILVICPNVVVSTKEVFDAKKLTENSIRIKIRNFEDLDFGNDLTSLVCKMYPEIQKVMDFLQNFGRPQLSGSGGCVFLSFTKTQDIKEVLDIIPSGWRAFVTSSLNASPLYKPELVNGV